MWPFNRKKEIGQLGPVCSHCGSTRTVVARHSDRVKAWRGQRVLACKCSDCGEEFYTGDVQVVPEEAVTADGLIEDEEELHAAEEELKRQADEDGDHTYR